MQNRIKELRKALSLNQTEFAKKLGIAPNTISSYESGTIEPSNSIIKSIVREYGVNETWLRTGAGDMFRSVSREQALGEGIRKILVDRPDSFQAALISTLLKFDPDGAEWAALERIAAALLEETKKDRKP